MRTRLLRFVGLCSVFLAACGGADTEVKTGGPAPQGTDSAKPSSPAPSVSASAAAPAAVVKDEVKVVDADTPMTTASGSTYIAPKGWSVTTKNGVILLEDPNHEVSLFFVELKAQDGLAAIAAAWKQVKPDFARAVKMTIPSPGRGGWDAILQVTYETTVSEARTVFADAGRKGDTWFVALSDGTRDGLRRRAAQAGLARESYRGKDVVEESFKGKVAHTLDAARLQKLEAFLEENRRAVMVPGIAVAIVQGGKVVFEKGFGEKQLGKKDPVTPKTLFRIASMTKPLTSLMIAGLVDEGKFKWDTRVTELLPSFALGDADLTQRLTMRSILCACTGIPYDNVGTDYEYKGISGEKVLERMKELKPTTGFGETFQYSNTMIAGAGFVAAHAVDPKAPVEAVYEKVMQEKVFGPLGMKNTTFDPKVVSRGDHASPHDRNAKFEMELLPPETANWVGALNPAGGAWSTVTDLSKFLLMELAKGKTPDGKQVVSEQNLLARREPQARLGEKYSYGLALGVELYRDVRVYEHTGGLDGWAADMFFLPDHDIGAVILGNANFPNPLVYEGFKRKLFELLFDGRDEASEDIAVVMKEREVWFADQVKKVDFAPPRAFSDRFVGTYKHPLYGELTIRADKKGLLLDAGEWSTLLGKKTEADGTEKLIATTGAQIYWPEFLPKEVNGKMTLELQDNQRKVVFERVKGGK